MLALLQTPLLVRQPTTMKAVEYQRVQQALPNGAPDLTAPDNAWIRVEMTWYVMLDSEAVPPDASGTRHMHLAGFDYVSYRKTSQTGRLKGKLGDRFKELWSPKKETLKVGQGNIAELDYDLPKGNDRRMHLYTRTVVERVEVHTEGRSRVVRTQREGYWGTVARGGIRPGPSMPEAESTFAAEAKPHVRVDPVTYGYEPVHLPKDDEL